jgi:hypothetical protein
MQDGVRFSMWMGYEWLSMPTSETRQTDVVLGLSPRSLVYCRIEAHNRLHLSFVKRALWIGVKRVLIIQLW